MGGYWNDFLILITIFKFVNLGVTQRIKVVYATKNSWVWILTQHIVLKKSYTNLDKYKIKNGSEIFY